MSETTTITVADALTGVQLAAPGQCRCQTCHTALHDGHPVQAYAYQPADQPEWDVPRVYCHDCGPNEIRVPTLGTQEAICEAWLGSLALAADQHARLVVTDVTLIASSPLDEGARP